MVAFMLRLALRVGEVASLRHRKETAPARVKPVLTRAPQAAQAIRLDRENRHHSRNWAFPNRSR